MFRKPKSSNCYAPCNLLTDDVKNQIGSLTQTKEDLLMSRVRKDNALLECSDEYESQGMFRVLKVPISFSQSKSV